jgi:HK97 family phage portal protein
VTVTERDALSLPAVYAAVTLRSDTVAQLPIQLFRRDGDRRERVPDHPVADLLLEPNNAAGYGITTLFGTSMLHGDLWGNSYIEIERSADATPIALWLRDPESTYPVTDALRGRFSGIEGYRMSVSGQQYDVRRENMIHVRGVTLDGYIGLSPVQRLRDAIASAVAMERYAGEFFKNDAKSGGFLLHPGNLSEQAKRNIVESIYAQATDGDLKSSRREQHRIKVLEEGMKFIETTQTAEDSQLNESREMQLSEIARAYRTPLILLQSINGSTVWGTGIEHLLIAFVTLTIVPIIRRYEDELSRKLLTLQERADGLYIHINEKGLLRGDSAARAAFYQTLVTLGVMTRNEARVLEEMNPLPGLDTPLTPVNMVNDEDSDTNSET